MQSRHDWRSDQPLKQDVFGRVDRIVYDAELVVSRRATGSRIPGSRMLARHLLRREKRALQRLELLPGVPHLRAQLPASDHALLRSWIPGTTLSCATAIPVDFFDHLDTLVAAVHALGICHNDLHKEQNILLGEDGYPYLLDFQLSSVHRRDSRMFRARRREDLRHVQKHRLRYVRHMPTHAKGPAEAGVGVGIKKGWPARLWMRFVKPIYNVLLRRSMRWSENEKRRPRTGSWPVWLPPSGPREAVPATPSAVTPSAVTP